MLRAIRDGLGSNEVPQDYFYATHETADEAEAMYALHAARVRMSASDFAPAYDRGEGPPE